MLPRMVPLGIGLVLALVVFSQLAPSATAAGPTPGRPARSVRAADLTGPVLLRQDPRNDKFSVAAKTTPGNHLVAQLSSFQVNFISGGSTIYLDQTPYRCEEWPVAAKVAFGYATAVWGSLVRSSVPITIDACWTTLEQDILGATTANEYFYDFAGAPRTRTLYPAALANALSGSDLDGDQSDMTAVFNQDFSWDFDASGTPPPGYDDFATVVLHEIAHGLGFSGSMALPSYEPCPGVCADWGYGFGAPMSYDQLAENAAGQSLVNTGAFPNPSAALANQLTSDGVYFGGPQAIAANGGHRPRLYAPTIWQGGSSYSHLDTVYDDTIDALMTYSIAYQEVVHDPGPIAMAMLRDVGWQTAEAPSIASFDASSGEVGSTVTIQGTNLGGASLVRFNATASAAFTVDSDTQITATVPVGATTGPISVTTLGGTATSASTFDVTTVVTCDAGTFRTEYFTDGGSQHLQLSPAAVLCEDGPIDHRWGKGGPGVLTGVYDDFSARWAGTLPIASAGTYTFTATVDDGVRLWVDDKLVMDRWRPQSQQKYEASVPLATGDHAVRMEYFEATGQAVASLDWTLACPVGQVKAEYYNGVAPPTDGTRPAISRCEAAPIYHDWGAGSPGNGISADSYSARYVGLVSFESADYSFEATADDGVRLRVDGSPVLDGWKEQGPTTYQGTSTLTAGLHAISMEYFEKAGGALARLTWRVEPCPVGVDCVEYFPNKTLTHSVLDYKATEVGIDHQWGLGGPGYGIPTDGFSARWQGTHTFEAADYLFVAKADDGIRLWVDGDLIVDQWKDESATEYRVVNTMAAGDHQIRVEYYENTGGALAQVHWQKGSDACADVPAGQFCAQYFGNPTLAGAPIYTAVESAPISHDWGTAGPGGGVPNTNFSVRWSGTFAFATAGTFAFTATADDGVRVWVDGQPIVEGWRDQAPTTYTANKALSSGLHAVSVDYYQGLGGAVARLSWSVPRARSEVTVDDQSAGFARGGRYWKDVKAGYLGHFFGTTTDGARADSWGEWRGNLAGGVYEVLVFVPAGNSYTTAGNSTLKAPYTVYYQGGQKTVVVSQSANLGRWVSLGTYTFAAGTTRQVRLTDATGEPVNAKRIAFDAVRFVPR